MKMGAGVFAVLAIILLNEGGPPKSLIVES
jgi:hypothetical protein